MKSLFLLFVVFTSCLCCEDRWEASSHAVNSTFHSVYCREVLARYRFLGNERILDVGCGDGFITHLLAKKVPFGSVLGIDHSPSMIERTKKIAPHDNLRFELSNVEEIQMQEQFDLVTLFFSLQWIKGQLNVLSRVEAALVPNGKLLIIVPHKMPESMRIVAMAMMDNPNWKSYFDAFQPTASYLSYKELLELLHEAGLSPIRFDVRKQNVILGSREVFRNFLDSSLYYLDALPLDLKRSWTEEFIDQYQKIVPSDSLGRFSYSIELFEILAEKLLGAER